MDGSEDCSCGDVFDEHEDNGGPCTIEGCPCAWFELWEDN